MLKSYGVTFKNAVIVSEYVPDVLKLKKNFSL